MDLSEFSNRQRVRNVQLVILLTGGMLIFMGFMRHEFHGNVSLGYHELWEEQNYRDAAKAFEGDLEDNPERIESYLGLTLSYLFLERFPDARDTWHELTRKRGKDEPLIKNWGSKDPRAWRRYEGEVRFATAWLNAIDLLRAYRLGEDTQEITEMQKQYNTALEEFDSFLQRKQASAVDPKVETERVKLWRGRLSRIRKQVEMADRMSDLDAALNLKAKPDPHGSGSVVVNDTAEVSDANLLNMYNVYLSRTIPEIEALDDKPTRIWQDLHRAYSIALETLAELTRRELRVRDGEAAATHLEGIASKSADLFQSPPVLDVGETPSAYTRLRSELAFNIAAGLAQLAVTKAGGGRQQLFVEQAGEYFKQGQLEMDRLQPSDPAYTELKAIEERVRSRVEALRDKE